MLLSTRCIHGFMANLIKKSWTDSKHAAGGTDAVSTYSQNLWKYSKKVYKMKYNGIIWTFLFMSQESKKCITSFSSKIFLLGKLSQLTRKKPKVNKQIYFSGWLVSLYAIVYKKKTFLHTILRKWHLSNRKGCSYNFGEFIDQFKEDWRKKDTTKLKLIPGAHKTEPSWPGL